MSRLLLILGGARSGKSAYAEQRLAGMDDVVYVATLRRGDPDVDARIAAHRARRPPSWTTVDAGDNAAAAIRGAAPTAGLLLDGFELALSVADLGDEAAAQAMAEDVAAAAREAASRLSVVVSAEAGMGVVPSTASGGVFRDLLGAANQVLAARADEVVVVIAGLPLSLRG